MILEIRISSYVMITHPSKQQPAMASNLTTAARFVQHVETVAD